MRTPARLLLLLSISVFVAFVVGCGSDPAAAILSTAGGATPQVADFAPLSAVHSAQVVGAGTSQDASTANQTADGLLSVLSGGAVDAATLGASSGVSSSSAAGVLHNGMTTASVGRGSHAAALAVTGPIQFIDGRLEINDGSGVNIAIQGVSVTQDTTSGHVTRVVLSGNERIVGTLPLSIDGQQELDVRIQGISGTISPVTSGPPAVALAIDPAGVKISGQVGSIDGEVDLAGVSGLVASGDDLDQLLAGHTLTLFIPQLHVKDVLNDLKAQVSLVNLHFPVDGATGQPSGSVYGQADATLHPSVVFTKDGRIQRAVATVDHAAPLVFQTAGNGPTSGTIQVALYFRSGRRDDLTVTIAGGTAQLSGSVTNLSGEDETVDEDNGNPRVKGRVKFADGRTADHEIRVARVSGGRQITFTITLKDAAGDTALTFDGTIRPDHSIQGTWGRHQPAASGAFRVTSGGLLTILDASGSAVATAQLPEGWDKSL